MGKIKVKWDKFYDEAEEEKKRHRLRIQAPKYDNDMQELVKFFKKAANAVKTKSRKHTFENEKPDFNDFDVFKKHSYPGFNYNSTKQLCVCKMRYSMNKQVHQKFLDHYMVQENKPEVINKPKLFGNISQEEYKKLMSKKCFKWIISPERNLTEEQLKLVARNFIERTQQHLGKKLDWQGAVHQDTSHNHVHLLINGVDQEGKDLKLPKNFIQKISHNIMSEYLTAVLGERTPEEIAAAKENRVYAERFTEYDGFIEELENPIPDKEYPSEVFTEDLKLRKRLEFLEDFGLAKYSQGKYKLEKDWKDTLRNTGKYNTYSICRKDYKFKDREIKMYSAEIGKIKGKVSRYYNMNDEDIWNNAIVVDDINGKTSWYVPLYKEEDSLLNKEIELSLSKNQKGYFEPKIIVFDEKTKKANAGKDRTMENPKIEHVPNKRAENDKELER